MRNARNVKDEGGKVRRWKAGKELCQVGDR